MTKRRFGATYTGPRADLKGERAMVVVESGGRVLAFFENASTIGLGWFDFAQEDFTLDEQPGDEGLD